MDREPVHVIVVRRILGDYAKVRWSEDRLLVEDDREVMQCACSGAMLFFESETQRG
jgi:hypothetical protein